MRLYRPTYRVETKAGRLLWQGNNFAHARALAALGKSRQVLDYSPLHQRYYVINPYYLRAI